MKDYELENWQNLKGKKGKSLIFIICQVRLRVNITAIKEGGKTAFKAMQENENLDERL